MKPEGITLLATATLMTAACSPQAKETGAGVYIGSETEVIDTTGQTVMPGFISRHDHLIASA